jgi:hypothetical protein
VPGVLSAPLSAGETRRRQSVVIIDSPLQSTPVLASSTQINHSQLASYSNPTTSITRSCLRRAESQRSSRRTLETALVAHLADYDRDVVARVTDRLESKMTERLHREVAQNNWSWNENHKSFSKQVPLTMLQIGQNHKNENHDASVVILGLSISPTF